MGFHVGKYTSPMNHVGDRWGCDMMWWFPCKYNRPPIFQMLVLRVLPFCNQGFIIIQKEPRVFLWCLTSLHYPSSSQGPSVLESNGWLRQIRQRNRLLGNFFPPCSGPWFFLSLCTKAFLPQMCNPESLLPLIQWIPGTQDVCFFLNLPKTHEPTLQSWTFS